MCTCIYTKTWTQYQNITYQLLCGVLHLGQTTYDLGQNIRFSHDKEYDDIDIFINFILE